MLVLLPLLLLVLWPVDFGANEYVYFMQPVLTVAPDRFSEFSAVFDATSARIVWEHIIGFPLAAWGYDATHAVARVLLAAAYAASLAYLFNALKLSVIQSLLVLSLFLIVGEDILGKEWLFQGVESKCLAYVFTICAFAFVIRRRMFLAVLFCVGATYLHFLVGGFWLVAFLAYDAMRRFSAKRLLVYAAIYAAFVLPLILSIAYQQFVSLGAEPRDPSASHLYSVVRHPHHVAPFSSVRQLQIWLPDILFLLVLLFTFFWLMRRDMAKSKTLAPWVAGLLCYLVFALLLSVLDAQTGYLGKFHLFRPSSLTLLFALAALVLLLGTAVHGKPRARYFQSAACVVAMLLAITGTMYAKATEASEFRRAMTADIDRLNAYIVDRTGRDEIVLVEPGTDEYVFPKVALPMLLDRPTLVSFKFVPTNARDIYRWYDLLQYRDGVFEKECRAIDRFPVRYLLMMRKADTAVPCGRIVWSSDYFVLVEP